MEPLDKWKNQLADDLEFGTLGPPNPMDDDLTEPSFVISWQATKQSRASLGKAVTREIYGLSWVCFRRGLIGLQTGTSVN